MTVSLNANPGQTILLGVQILNNNGSRLDGYAPTFNYLRNPSGSTVVSPTLMTNIDTGLYQISITVPSGITAIGTYIGSASWTHPDTSETQYELFLINVHLAFGLSTVSPA